MERVFWGDDASISMLTKLLSTAFGVIRLIPARLLPDSAAIKQKITIEALQIRRRGGIKRGFLEPGELFTQQMT